jgi:hypothetical protein
VSARRHSTAVLVIAALVVAACRSQEQAATDSTVHSTSNEARNPRESTAKRYSLADFRQLGWLEGRWRGSLPNGGYFYEQYAWRDDSTIVMHSFADSTFARATDSARIVFRARVVANEGATARWEATRLDSVSVEFIPIRGASNSFAWLRESPTRWTATLRSADREGRSRQTVYRMERFGSGGE